MQHYCVCFWTFRASLYYFYYIYVFFCWYFSMSCTDDLIPTKRKRDSQILAEKKYNIKKRCAQNYRIIHARGGVRLKYEDIKCCDAWIKKVKLQNTNFYYNFRQLLSYFVFFKVIKIIVWTLNFMFGWNKFKYFTV
jgi:hypothetical protein